MLGYTFSNPLPDRMKMFAIRALLVATALLAAAAAHAQLSIEITGSSSKRFPVAIPLLENEGSLPESVSDVVRADLERSGLFNLVDTGLSTFPESVMPDLPALRGRGADAALTGSVVALQDGRYSVRVRLFDTNRRVELGSLSLHMSPRQSSITAHRIADFVYEKLLGEPGYFSTRIAYVVVKDDRHELQIADADGANPQPALISREPIISPSWSPDGKRLAYVSFEAKKPIIYVHDLPTGRRQQIANFRGSNSAPAWSPDGSRLAIVLTKDGPSQIYIINTDGSGLRRLLTSQSIDTEPTWSPDGRSIYFTSDRGGSPQIYRVSVDGGPLQRVTFDGTYNVTPRVSPDGRSLAYTTRRDGRFQVGLLELATGRSVILTDEVSVESPSFSPNGRMILYASGNASRGVLSAVSTDGRVRQRLTIQAAEIREPAWGPISR
jgi:TolB protein